MYLGRIVAAGMTKDGKPVAAYRVSSRSFPNRTAHLANQTISIIPRKGFESDLSASPEKLQLQPMAPIPIPSLKRSWQA